MANFAKIENGIVTTTFIAEQAEVDKGTFGDASTIKEWKRDGSIRANAAIIGSTYDASADKFYYPKPFASWTLDSDDNWTPPLAKPSGHYYWDETIYQGDNTKGWVEDKLS
jgi:hypothetical protein